MTEKAALRKILDLIEKYGLDDPVIFEGRYAFGADPADKEAWQQACQYLLTVTDHRLPGSDRVYGG